jgi:hypothetical protein
MGFMKKEIAAIRAGMFVLIRILEAKGRGQAVVTVPDLYLDAMRMLSLVDTVVPLTFDELKKIKDIAQEGGTNRCPHCGYTTIEGDNLRSLTDSVIQSMQCTKCEETWDNHYVLVEQYLTS